MYCVPKFENNQEPSHIIQFSSVATFHKLLQDNLLSYVTQLSEKFKCLLRKISLIKLMVEQMLG